MNLVLSIITINLNNQTGLQKTIESVINQTFKNLEFIVIDGGSTDGSIEVIKLYQDKITYWISEHDEGIYNAMNKGIKIAKGRYCLFLNSGDFFISHDVIKLADPFSFTVPIVYGDGKVQQKKLITQINLPDTLSLDYFFNISLFHPSTFIKRELFEIYGLYNENNKIVSDWEFFLKTIIINNVETKKIPISIAILEDGGISTSQINKVLLEKERKQVLESYFPSYILTLLSDYNELKKQINSNSIAKHLKYKIKKYIRFIFGLVVKK